MNKLDKHQEKWIQRKSPVIGILHITQKRIRGNMSNIKYMEKNNTNGCFCLSDIVFAERKCNGVFKGIKEKNY